MLVRTEVPGVSLWGQVDLAECDENGNENENRKGCQLHKWQLGCARHAQLSHDIRP